MTRQGGVYKKLVVKNDTLIGAVLYGDTADGAWYFKLVKDARQHPRDSRSSDVRPERVARRRSSHAGHAHVATMPDEAEVCGCNGVCKGHDRQGDQGPTVC
jgi:nitrite reductase (NADH) large subunit